VTSVLHYTDALPPHELPIVVTGLAEEELGQTGTENAMRRAHATLDPERPSVVVTGSIAEMIGGGVTPRDTNIQRFLPRTIDEDQWQSADRALFWLWDRYGKASEETRWQASKGKRRRAADVRSRASTSSARSTAASTPGPTSRRSAASSRASVPRSTWCSRWAPPRRHPETRRRRRQHLHVPRVRAQALRGAGQALPAGADRPALNDGVPRIPRRTHSGLDPQPFIEREKHTTIKPLWDLWRSVTQDFFGTANFGGRRQRDLHARPASLPRRRAGHALQLRRVALRLVTRPTTRRSAR
jgi:chlorophyllide a reductase subunit Z